MYSFPKSKKIPKLKHTYGLKHFELGMFSLIQAKKDLKKEKAREMLKRLRINKVLKLHFCFDFE